MKEQDHTPKPEPVKGFEFILEQLPDEFIADGFRTAVFAENWDARDRCFDTLDNRRLAAMEAPALQEELQFRKRFEEIEGATWRDYAIRTFTIALIGSDEEKKAIFDSVIEPLKPISDTYARTRILNQRLIPDWKKILQIRTPIPPQT